MWFSSHTRMKIRFGNLTTSKKLIQIKFTIQKLYNSKKVILSDSKCLGKHKSDENLFRFPVSYKTSFKVCDIAFVVWYISKCPLEIFVCRFLLAPKCIIFGSFCDSNVLQNLKIPKVMVLSCNSVHGTL